MKILFTADLHLLQATQERTLAKVRGWAIQHHPDVFVVAGDLSSAQQAADTLKNLRQCFPEGPIAVCLGNHDFWVFDQPRRGRSLSEIIDRYWVPAAESFGIVLLDVANLYLQDLVIVGGYGHYDLGFAIPKLAYDGILVTEKDYLRGRLSSGSPLRWRDFQFMPSEQDLREVAREQVEGVRRRLAEAGNSRTVVVLHTPPFEELLGIPPFSPLPTNSTPSEYAFFRAYLGNRSMGIVLRESPDNLSAIVCGHTHRRAGPINLGRTVGINIGSDYGAPKGALFLSDSNRFERLPD